MNAAAPNVLRPNRRVLRTSAAAAVVATGIAATPPSQPDKEPAMKRAFVPIAILVATATVSSAAYGLLGAGHSSDTQALTAATMPAGNQPTAVVSGDDVSLSWAASTLPDTTPMSGYFVTRHQGATVVPTTGGCAGVVTGTTCTEADVPVGVWEYGITPKYSNWTGPESPRLTVEV